MQAELIKNRYDLLILLNKIKKQEYGQKAHPFSIAQLNYFCHPARNSKHYVKFSIPKKSGGKREIYAPQKMLKSLLRCVNLLLQSIYEPSLAAMGFVPGRSIVDNAKKHLGMNYVLNMDLSDFFPSISQARVWGALKSKAIGFNENVASALAGLCCTEMQFEDGQTRCVLPQGSPASPILTNIICINLDRRLTGLAKRFGANYTRYADDITFSSQHNIYKENGEFILELRRIIADQNFRINEKKTRLQKRGARQEVTGLVVSDRVNVVRKYARALSSLLYIWKQYGYDAAYGRFLAHRIKEGKYESHAPAMERVIEGRLNFLKMVKGDANPVYTRLNDLFVNLLKAKNEKIADINYLSTFTMVEFEQLFNTNVKFFLKEIKPGLYKYTAECVIGGRITSLCLSSNCRKQLKSANSDATTEECKKGFYVSYCFSYYTHTPFWLIMKTRPKDIYQSTIEKRYAF